MDQTEKNCGSCRYPEGGVCYNCEGVKGATEISSLGCCANWAYNRNIDSLSFTEYQALAARTDAVDLDIEALVKYGPLINAALGMAGEAGEFADLVKKLAYQGHILDDQVVDKLLKELGDELWYVAKAARVLKSKLTTVAEMNIDKLKQRYPDGFDPARSRDRGRGNCVRSAKTKRPGTTF